MRNVGKKFCCYLMARQFLEQDTVRWQHIGTKVRMTLLEDEQAVFHKH